MSYISPYKLAHLDDDGTFRLQWFKANERLKGAPLSTTPDPLDGRFVSDTADVSAGFVAEATFLVPAPSAPVAAWPGFLLDQGSGLALSVALQPDGIVTVGDYRTFEDVEYAAGGVALPTQSAADWAFSGGASPVATRVPHSKNGTDLRSGSPGGVGIALLTHPLDSKSHLLEELRLSFTYVAGYSPAPSHTANGTTLSVGLVDAHNGSNILASLCTTPALSNFSFDHFTSESPPVHCNATGLAIGWPRQMAVKLVLTNHQRNVQIPLQSIKLHVRWGGLQPGPYSPSPVPPSVTVRERWSRDYDLGLPGSKVPARLLYRRGMLELYLHDFLYPVYCDRPGTGRFGVMSRNGTVTALRWWRMTLPADAEWDEPSRQPPPDSEGMRRAKFGVGGDRV